MHFIHYYASQCRNYENVLSPILDKIRENNGLTKEVEVTLFSRNFLEESIKFLDFPHCAHVEGRGKSFYSFVKQEHQSKRYFNMVY